jgi:hypothetical protein
MHAKNNKKKSFVCTSFAGYWLAEKQLPTVLAGPSPLQRIMLCNN